MEGIWYLINAHLKTMVFVTITIIESESSICLNFTYYLGEENGYYAI